MVLERSVKYFLLMLAEDMTRRSFAREHRHTLLIHAEYRPFGRALHKKYLLRKHDRNAYYGQVKSQ